MILSSLSIRAQTPQFAVRNLAWLLRRFRVRPSLCALTGGMVPAGLLPLYQINATWNPGDVPEASVRRRDALKRGWGQA